MSILLASLCVVLYMCNLSTDYTIETGDPSLCNCAMVVAHPDDETIFGGQTLLHSSSDQFWHVVVMTNARNKKRVRELNAAMSHFPQVKAITVFDTNDNILFSAFPFLCKRFPKLIVDQVKHIVNDKIIVIGHNEKGEYGHVQHKAIYRMLFDMQKNMPDTKFAYFQFGLHRPIKSTILDALAEYKSQRTSIKKYMYLASTSLPIIT